MKYYIQSRYLEAKFLMIARKILKLNSGCATFKDNKLVFNIAFLIIYRFLTSFQNNVYCSVSPVPPHGGKQNCCKYS